MSLVLLDTHAWVWLMNGSPRLGRKARKAIEKSAEEQAVLVSAISPWEVAMLVGKQRLVLDRDVGEWVAAGLSPPGIRLESLTPEIAVASTRMPGQMHGDPADRIIAATTRHCHAALVTDDAALLEYARAGYLKAVPAAQ